MKLTTAFSAAATLNLFITAECLSFSSKPKLSWRNPTALYSATVTDSTTISWESLSEKISEIDEASSDKKRDPVLTFYRDTNGWCPFCERVWVCIKAKDLPYEERLISLFNKPDWYKELVPTTQVPAVLLHEWNSATAQESEESSSNNSRKLVWESLDIMKALDDAFPDTPKLVLDTPEYSEAQTQIEELGKAGFGYIYASRGNVTLTTEELEERKNEFILALDNLDKAIESSGGPFRLGEQFTGVDAQMIPTLERWRYQLPLAKNSMDILQNRPNLQKWFQAMDSFAPYSERAAGDEYSWVATSAMFARYFGNGDEDPDTIALIERSEKAADALTANFKSTIDVNECEERFAHEAARKIISNYEAIVKDCTNPEPKSQAYISRSSSEENANIMIQYVAELLLVGGEKALENATTLPLPNQLSSMDKDQKRDAADAAKTIAKRLCVPRDMSAPAAKILRAILMIVSEKLST